MGRVIREWRQREVLAEISGRVVNNMYDACKFVEEAARAHAAVLTGRMRGEITSEITSEIVAQGEEIVGRVGLPRRGKAFYAYFVEMGTRKMAARPFLRPALYNNLREILRILSRS